MKPAAASPDLTPKQWEISALLASAVHLADWQPHEASLFQHNQPLSVRRHFTLQALRHCFDAAGVRAATPSGPVPLPDDLLRLIGDYAPIELPYLPLVSVLESARPPNSASAAPPRGAADSPLDACQQRAMAALQAAAIAVLQSPAVAELAVATAVARACGAMDSQWCVLPSVQHWQAQFCELVEDHARSADLMPDRSCVTCLAPISRAQDHSASATCPECGASRSMAACRSVARQGVLLNRGAIRRVAVSAACHSGQFEPGGRAAAARDQARGWDELGIQRLSVAQ